MVEQFHCTHKKQGRYRPLRVIAGFILMGLPVAQLHADAFLDLIKQEVDAVQLDPTAEHSITGAKPTPGVQPQPQANPAAKATSDMPTGMSQDAFKTYLENRYMGSYSFYRKLDKADQQAIFQAYVKQPEIQFVRDKIKQIYLKP